MLPEADGLEHRGHHEGYNWKKVSELVQQLEHLLDKAPVIHSTDYVSAIAIELHADSILNGAYREMTEIIVGNVSEGRQLRYGIGNLCLCHRFPVLVIAAKDLLVGALIFSKSLRVVILTHWPHGILRV